MLGVRAAVGRALGRLVAAVRTYPDLASENSLSSRLRVPMEKPSSLRSSTDRSLASSSERMSFFASVPTTESSTPDSSARSSDSMVCADAWREENNGARGGAYSK